MLKNLSLVFFSSLFSLYLTEVIIALTLDPLTRVNEKARSYRLHQPGFDKRNIREVVKDERSKGNIVYPFIPLVHLFKEHEIVNLFKNKNLPLGSIPYSQIILCNENGKFSQYINDRFGFNNPDDIHESKIDTIAIGDSFLHGQCVDNHDNPIEILRSKLATIYNLSISGANPLHELALLKEYGIRTGAKKILWFYYEGNDYKFNDHLSNKILSYYLKPNFTQNLESKSDEIKNIKINQTEKLISESKEFNFHARPWAFNLSDIFKLRNLEKIYKINFGDEKNKMLSPLFLKTFEELKRISIKNGIEVVIVYLPDYSRYTNNGPLFNHDKHLLRKDVLNFFKSLNIKVIDFHLVLEKKSDPLSYFPFRHFGHYNPAGYKLLADEVLRNVLKTNQR